jgi:hypothetical protein
MYSTCLFCNHDLGRNESVEAFPVGRRLAFDPACGRLWVVCRRCERWNLSPLEERWEAFEECERLFRGTRLRMSTDQIGLARLPDGLELVRIGEPLRPEFAAWRYGGQFGRRRRRAILVTGAGVTLLAGLTIGLSVAGGSAGGLWGIWNVWLNVPGRTRLRTADGRILKVRHNHLHNARLFRDPVRDELVATIKVWGGRWSGSRVRRPNGPQGCCSPRSIRWLDRSASCARPCRSLRTPATPKPTSPGRGRSCPSRTETALAPFMPDVWSSSRRTGMRCPCVSKPGGYRDRSASRSSFPWSRSWRTAAAVNCFVTEPISNTASTGMGNRHSRSGFHEQRVRAAEHGHGEAGDAPLHHRRSRDGIHDGDLRRAGGLGGGR